MIFERPLGDGWQDDNDCVEPSNDCVEPSNDCVEITDNQKTIMEQMIHNPKITINELANMIGITPKNVTNNIKRLKENKVIKRVGSDRYGYWEVLK